jgi:hypothetical protein
MLIRATQASHVEQWWPEVSKADVVDSERSISSNIFADAWLLDRTCEGSVLPLCGLFGVEEGYSATERRRKNRDELENRANVDAESMMAVTRRTTRMPFPVRVLIAAPPLDFFVVWEGGRDGQRHGDEHC